MHKLDAADRQAGFSLVELMVAMVITLIVSGAIYGLIAGGESAFKRDPEISDRQQNIRVAMDEIQREIVEAGNKLGLYYQVFGIPCDGVGIMRKNMLGQNDANTDHLIIYTANDACPDAPVNTANPFNGDNIVSQADFPNCYADDSMVAVIYGNYEGAQWGFAHRFHGQATMVNFPPGLNNAASGSQIQDVASLHSYNGMTPTAVVSMQTIRYEVANEPDGTPGLWRSTTGGRDLALGGAYVPAPGLNATPGLWQLIARGIEDMQIQYLQGNAWVDTPTVILNNGTTVVTQVRVTLQARTGTLKATAAANADQMRLRGQLTSVGSPRASLNYLSTVNLWQ